MEHELYLEEEDIKLMATYQPYTEYSTIGGGGFESRPTTGDSSSSLNRSNTLTPVTIKQILNSTQEVQDGPFISSGQELHHICFVGVIRNITDNTSNIHVSVEDGTGQIEVRKWSDDINDIATSQENDGKISSSQLSRQYHIGTYVKVYGALKEFSGKKNIQYAVIKNIESFNEVLAHHLEVIKWHAIATGRLPDPSGSNAGTETALNGNENDGRSLFVGGSQSTDKFDGSGSGSPLQRILEFCRKQCEGKDANSFAVPIPLIAQTLNIDEATTRECCTTLTDQGFIYPTFDDNHFFAL